MKFSKWLHVPKKIIEQQFCELAEKEIGLRGKILFEKSKIKKKKKRYSNTNYYSFCRNTNELLVI